VAASPPCGSRPASTPSAPISRSTDARWLRPRFCFACLASFGFLACFGFLPTLVEAQSRAGQRRLGKAKGELRATLQQAIEVEFIDVNNVLTVIDNRGSVGIDPRGPSFGFFPANSPNNYLFASGLWVGGLVDGVKVVSETYDFANGSSEFNPGRADGSGGGEILCSNDASDLEQWHPEFSDPATEAPVVFSQKDCVTIYNDSNQQYDIQEPIGLDVRQRTMAFTFGLLSQVVFVVWDVVNTGSRTLEEAFVAVAADMDIGDDPSDDRCSAIPLVPPGANNAGPDTAATNLGFCWDQNFDEENFDPNPPGFIGVTFFQGPVGDTGDTLGLTRFTLVSNAAAGRPQPDPLTDAEQYDLLAGIGTRAPFVDAIATDMRIVEISGPITLAPGQTQRVVAGYIWANVSHGRTNLEVSSEQCFPQGSPCFLPDPNDPALEELIQVQRAAQLVFDAGFLAPAPPPKPDLTLIPGDQQVTVVFSDVSGVPDPFFRFAGDPASPAFDPLYHEFDFEGYVVVRSTTGDAADVDTLAIFDIVNDVVTIVDTTLGTFTIVLDESLGTETVVELPTNLRTIIDLPNTGLQFSFVDQGLINGLTYFYDVVPFDFNPSNTLRGEEISLSAGISLQPQSVHAVRPRSNASSFRSAAARFEALKADGTVCNVDEPTAKVDSVTGHYIDFIDCSNAIVQANLTSLRDVNIPSGEFFFVIDSILPSGTFDPGPTVGFTLAVGENTVFFHWEDGGGGGAPAGAGALSQRIQPNVGSFEQGPELQHTSETPVVFGLDSDPSDVGPDLSIGLVIAADFSVIEDLEVNGQSLHLGELGGTHKSERRPHAVANSSLADTVYIGNARGKANAREYSHPGPYTQGGASFELTWSVQGGAYSGTLRRLPSGEIVPPGGQPKGPDNPSTPADFIAGYNWGFIAPGTSAAVRDAVFPLAGPLTNSINLAVGNTFAIIVPGQSVYIEGIRTLPADGDRWTFLIDSGGDRSRTCSGGFETVGREPCAPTAPFSYRDVNSNTAEGQSLSPVPYARGIVNVYPGARWRLTVSGGSNDPQNADLARIKTVPNPYVANAVWDFSQDNQRLEFTNLPPVCTIRIYTLSGNLVRVIAHTNGSGTEVWDLQTRFQLKAASGTYYWHVTTPEGRSRLGLLSIIQGETSPN
jgi:hypothetical protein